MTFEEIQQIFIDRDPWGYICQGKDDDIYDDIYDKVAQSTYNFLSICNINRLTSDVLAKRIHYLLLAASFYTMVHFEECEILAAVILRKVKMIPHPYIDESGKITDYLSDVLVSNKDIKAWSVQTNPKDPRIYVDGLCTEKEFFDYMSKHFHEPPDIFSFTHHDRFICRDE